MIHQPITAQQGYGEYRPTCDDCGGIAAGQGPFYNRPYCRLCERHIASTGSAAERMYFNREPLAHVIQYDERNRLARIQADCRRLIGRAA